jgi:hypothetical protein
MKRDIFHRGARFTHDFSHTGQNDFDHFDPDIPKGMHLNTPGFCDHEDGRPSDPWQSAGAIEKPNHTKAHRGTEVDRTSGFFGIKLRIK